MSGCSRIADRGPAVVDHSPARARSDASRRAALPAPGYLVDQLGGDFVEQRDIKHEVAVFRRKAPPEARLDPPCHCVVAAIDPCRPVPPGVCGTCAARWASPPSQQPPSPAPAATAAGRRIGTRRVPKNRRSSAPTVIPRPSSANMAMSRPGGRSRNAIPTCSVCRRAAQQHVDHADRFGAAQPLEFVECQHTRRTVPLQRAEEQIEPILSLAVRGEVRLRSAGSRGA